MELDFLGSCEEEFNRCLLIAKCFVERLKRSKDRKICVHWIRRLLVLTPCNDITVGQNRNLFFRYLIKVIQQAVLQDLIQNDVDHILHGFKHMSIQDLEIVQDPSWLDQELDTPVIQEAAAESDAPYFAHWTDDQKTYIAAKALPGKGALVYMAVSTDPSQGWSNLV